jgi:hypothetical protein
MIRILWLILLTGSFSSAQSPMNGLAIGRDIALPALDSVELHYRDSLPADALGQYQFILVFSSGNSNLDTSDIRRLQEYLQQGGGLYIGADNWPFVAESNQLTFQLFGQRWWGNQQQTTAEINALKSSNEIFKDKKSIPAGSTTVAFPLDYRLKVEAWSGDEPLILSGKIAAGKLILDGGYSRFNASLNRSAAATSVFRDMLYFLARP